MPRIVPILVFALALVVTARGAAADPTAKPPDVRTVLPAYLSPPPSAAQLAKQRLATAPAPVEAPTSILGVKPAPFSTSSPLPAGSRRVITPAQKQPALAPILRGTPLGPARAAVKPPELVTAQPVAPARLTAIEAQIAAKRARAPTPVARPSARKPAATTTQGPPPATLAPEQLHKLPPAATPNSQRQP